MPVVSAVSVSPTWAAPLMAGVPVAGVLAACAAATGSVSQPAPVASDSTTETR